MARILIVDTGVILHSKQIFWDITARFITIPEVLEEIIDQKSLIFLDQLLTQKILEVIPPNDSNISFVRKEALNHLGESKNLSETDLSLTALAFEFKKKGNNVLICTNDLAIQNLANHLKIEFWGEKIIKKRIKWTFRCKGCGKTYSNKELEEFNLRECGLCGSELRKTPTQIIDI